MVTMSTSPARKRLAAAVMARETAQLGLEHALASTARVKGARVTPAMQAQVAAEEHAAHEAMAAAEAEFSQALADVIARESH
jgi:hypothetical protein